MSAVTISFIVENVVFDYEGSQYTYERTKNNTVSLEQIKDGAGIPVYSKHKDATGAEVVIGKSRIYADFINSYRNE